MGLLRERILSDLFLTRRVRIFDKSFLFLHRLQEGEVLTPKLLKSGMIPGNSRFSSETGNIERDKFIGRIDLIVEVVINHQNFILPLVETFGVDN